MRIPGARRLRASARWLRGRFGARSLVLGYHRVAEDRADPFGLCVSPDRFHEQVEVIARRARAISLREMVRGLRTGDLPHRAVALAFDDGYADVLDAARPVLERHDVPATVFLIAGCLGEELWWDRLRRAVEAGVHGGHPLRVALPAGDVVWEGGACRGGDVDGSGGKEAGHLLARLFEGLCALPGEARNEALAAIEEWGEGSLRASGRTLDPAELARLVDGRLVEAGAHSHTHPDLTALDRASLRDEIRQSRERLQAILARPVEGFSYPFGRTSPIVVEEVRKAGFAFACTSRPDLVRAGAGAYDVPRFWPGDWDGDRFERWLRWWS